MKTMSCSLNSEPVRINTERAVLAGMNGFICKLIDRWVIRAAAARQPRATGADAHLDEARRLLESADFFGEETPPAAITFTGGKNFQFPSPVVTAYRKTTWLWGACRAAGSIGGKGRRWCCCTDGTTAGVIATVFPGWPGALTAAASTRSCLSCPIISSAGRARARRVILFREDLGQTMEAAHQALAEINSVVNWLFQQGCPRVSLMGFSLGAWLGGLAACHNSRISCAALVTPVCRMDRMIEEVAFCEPIRQALKGKGHGFEPLESGLPQTQIEPGVYTCGGEPSTMRSCQPKPRRNFGRPGAILNCGACRTATSPF